MSCEKFDKYEMGELSAQEFERHVSECTSCREQSGLETRLTAETEALRAPVRAPYLWERIEAGLREEMNGNTGRSDKKSALRRFHRKWLVLVPAAALFLAAVGLAAIFALKQKIPASGLLADKALENIELKEREYIRAIQDLEKAARPKMAGMDLEMMSLYRDRLGTIDTQIERCREALAANPANAHIRRYMLAALQDKQETLVRVLENQD